MFAADGNWSNNTSPELWNKNNTLMTVNNGSFLKTIFDPSPSNYAVPKSAAFTGFDHPSGNVAGSWQYGFYFYTLGWQTGPTHFIPAIGDRYFGGNIQEHNEYINYWTAGPVNNSQAYDLNVRHNFINSALVLNKAYAFCIWACKL